MKGLEPSTFCMASRRSSQLSYIRASGEYRSEDRIARGLRAPLRNPVRRIVGIIGVMFGAGFSAVP